MHDPFANVMDGVMLQSVRHGFYSDEKSECRVGFVPESGDGPYAVYIAAAGNCRKIFLAP